MAREHYPVRPAWTCWADGQAWPCAAARAEFQAAYGADLPTVMAGLLRQASRELASVEQTELAERFVSWTWPPGNGRNQGTAKRPPARRRGATGSGA